MVIAHEVAHAAQYFRKYIVKKSSGAPHGAIWKTIYAHLRKTIINPMLPDQKVMKEDYEDYKLSLQNNKYEGKIDWASVRTDFEMMVNERKGAKRAASHS